MIRTLTISGFRGVVHPLVIDLTKGGKPVSLMVFGRNGAGKSSITDGWEWFHTGSIEHLAREGAMASAYPSRLPGGSAPRESYVEIVFHDQAGGTVRQSVGTGRTSASTNPAGLAWFRERTTHPCHIRFEDLNRFVYLTKSERFDSLAELMGFKEQVELQKQLRRVEKKIADQLTSARRTEQQRALAVKTHFKLSQNDDAADEAVVARLAGLFSRHAIVNVATWVDVEAGRAELALRIETDERAKELKDVEAFGRCVDRLSVPELDEALKSYSTALMTFLKEEQAGVADLLLGLYEKGEAALNRQRLAESAQGIEEGDICPLCGQEYTGDLLGHIQTELQALDAVRQLRDRADTARMELRKLLPAKSALAEDLATTVADAGSSAAQFELDDIEKHCTELDELLAELKEEITPRPQEIARDAADRIVSFSARLKNAVSQAKTAKTRLRKTVTERAAALSDSGERARLVDDHTKVVRGLGLWSEFKKASRQVLALTHCHDEFKALVERYVDMNVNDVDTRFSAISSDVDRYFGILEAHTEGVAHAALRLLRDQDRAVVLEVEFRGERISPAYSYLSESQLNSFGLAVFLASVRHINRDFRVVILDDVVNSFDAYKRPQMIRLLKQEFQDFQFIVLTHDDVWWAQLMDQCPQWARVRVKRYEPGIGPILEAAKSELEMVEAYLRDDEPTQAARTLGPMLERKLQALCDAMQVKVTYNARNEYTLRPLLQALLGRAKEKLGESHALFTSAKTLEENTTFRNFSAHWKNPASGLTSPEVREVLDQWRAVEAHVLCSQPTCGALTAWRSDVKKFACGCGNTVLAKATSANAPVAS